MKIWVDDIRTAPAGWIWAKTSQEAISLLVHAWQDGRTIDVMSLDHDLGIISVKRGKCTCGEVTPENRLGHKDGCRYFSDTVSECDTTRPVVLWCCENDFWPRTVVVHSANPVGIEWLEGMVDRYHPDNQEYASGYTKKDIVDIIDGWQV